MLKLMRSCIFLLFLVGISLTAYSQTQQGEATASDTRVVLLGTGNPVPDPERSGPCVAVVADGRAYLVDVGVGLVRRASAAAQKHSMRELLATELSIAFVTHLHSDHTIGLPDLILTPWVVGRRRPLELYGPPGIKEMAGNILEAYKEDIAIRVGGLEDKDTRGYRVEAHEIQDGYVFRDGRVKVTAFSVNHGTWKHAFGFRFDTPGRSIVISGDTDVSENLIKYAKGCDVLVHEVYSERVLKSNPGSWQNYHMDFHTSGVELGKIAAEVKPKLLVLYHQLTWSPKETVLSEIRENWDGEVAYGEDLDVY